MKGNKMRSNEPCVVIQDSDVMVAINEMTIALDALEGRLIELTGRLHCVTNISDGEKGDGLKKEAEECCELAATIRTMTSRIDGCLSRTNTQIRLLAL